LDLQELVDVLNAARSGKVALAVLQGGAVVPRDYELDPTEVPSPTVDQQFLWDAGLGYLHVSRFEPGTPEEIRKALVDWQAAGQLSGLILDLRDNPGGAVSAAVEIAGLFLPQGKTVVSLQGRSVPERKYSVEGSPPFPDLPLVVLLNGRSASASEMLAAALQDHRRAWLVGEQTFGKGVAESVMPLGDGNALVLTTARYFTPSGRSLQKPLPGTALAGILESGSPEFPADGRPAEKKGGVEPDQFVTPWNLDEWTGILLQTTAFINFAETYVEGHRRISERFVVSDETLQEFRRYLQASGLRVPEPAWQGGREFIRMSIQTEIFNLVFGLRKGMEASLRADPQARAAAEAMEKAERLSAGPAPR
jgi:carboxyl-terminal processing protease